MILCHLNYLTRGALVKKFWYFLSLAVLVLPIGSLIAMDVDPNTAEQFKFIRTDDTCGGIWAHCKSTECSTGGTSSCRSYYCIKQHCS